VRYSPSYRSQHTSAVQRIAWNHIEDRKGYVNVAQPEQNSSYRRKGWSARCPARSLCQGDENIDIVTPRYWRGIDGRQKLNEYCLNHLAGYESSRPVRIGNAACQQLQLDIYGEVMDSIYLANKYGDAISYAGSRDVQRNLDSWL
jgi:hypothetical protein